MVICVDFDGVCCEHKFPDIGKDIGAFPWLKKFQEMGAKLILYTMRSDSEKAGPVLSEAVEHCRKNGIEFYGVNNNPTQHLWSASPKVYGKLYIDDAALGCPLTREGFADWSKIGPKVEKWLRRELEKK